jgi:hypothetical protein
MIGVNTTYVVELYDDVWSQVFTTDDVDEAKYYVQTKRDNGNVIELSSTQRRFYEG